MYLIYLTADNCILHQERFELDSFIIEFYNHASKTISNQRLHFIGNFRPLPHQYIKGISGQISIKCQVTVIWKI